MTRTWWLSLTSWEVETRKNKLDRHVQLCQCAGLSRSIVMPGPTELSQLTNTGSGDRQTLIRAALAFQHPDHSSVQLQSSSKIYRPSVQEVHVCCQQRNHCWYTGGNSHMTLWQQQQATFASEYWQGLRVPLWRYLPYLEKICILLARLTNITLTTWLYHFKYHKYCISSSLRECVLCVRVCMFAEVNEGRIHRGSNLVVVLKNAVH